MVTSLAAQLGRIAASTSNTLDLKVVRRQHSKSLLFDPPIAINQSFDQIYTICSQGFTELCQLDNHFRKFGHSIFSPQSKETERGQLTSKENEELDVILEDFLQLVGSRLNLRPAQKAVEWLVRRFKIQDYNTVPLLLAFLPYHTTPLFSVLVAILPRNTPSIVQFIEPYRRARAPLVRHAIISVMITKPLFFVRLADLVIDVCRKGYEHRNLVSWWAGVAAEALAGQLDGAASGRSQIKQDRQQDVLVRILPILNAALPLSRAPDLQIAAYMLTCILVSKTELEDQVILALMDMVVADRIPRSESATKECLRLLEGRLSRHEASTNLTVKLMLEEG